MLLDPIALLTVLVKRFFLDGDGLEEHAAVRLQQAIASSKVVVVVLIAHSFKHFNADDLVVLSSQGAVVFEQQLDAFSRFAPGENFTRVVVLLTANGYRSYATSVSLSHVCREAAPAGADFEHVILWAELEFAADAIELADLCLLQSIVGAFVISTRVGQVAIQEEAIEVVAKIVVIRDIAAAAGLRVAAAAMLKKVSEPAEGGQEAIAAVQLVQVSHRQPDDRDQIGRRPVALTITFLILKVSGIPMLEKKMAGNPDFAEYKRRTNEFLPWAPRR